MSHKPGDRSSGWERAVRMRDLRRDPTARAQARQMLHSGFRTAAAMHLWCATHFIEPVSALQHATLRSPARHGCESVFAETPSAVPRPTANSQLFSHRRVDYHIDVTISPVCKCLDIQIVPTCN